MSKNHLAEARHYLTIGESKDSKREAFKMAAKEIAAHRDETADTIPKIASELGREASFIRMLLKWRESGHKADTPWLMDTNATNRAERSHARKILREGSLDEIESMISDLPLARVTQLMHTVEGVQAQLHPATSVKGPGNTIPAYRRGYPFLLQMGRVSAKLIEAIDMYVDTWDEHAENATAEELQTERDMVAPKLQRLRMTVEEMEVNA